jgi:hypothetical protein
MKWDSPMPVRPSQFSLPWELEQEWIPSKNDPAFSDFNLPLLDQLPVGRWVLKKSPKKEP